MPYALEYSGHFLFEKRSEPYKRYGEVSITEEKCPEYQEMPYKDRLVLAWEGSGA
jgi:hypothetical protein